MRKSNFELLRLFCIFGIVVMHAMGNIDTSLSVWNTESHIFVNALFSVCSLSNLFFRFHTTTLTEACSNELKQHHL